MYIVRRLLSFLLGCVKRYGPSRIKQILWDREFAVNKWNFIDNTVGDCVYPYLERYAKNGSILDLGCGPGNTANELAATAYQTYVGVDVSEVALSKARKRTQESGRLNNNLFAQEDFLTYVPTQQFDVILFRESMYHVPLGKVKAILDRYSRYLKDHGVFIVKMSVWGGKNNTIRYRPKAMMDVMETEYDVLEERQHNQRGPTVIVFRPTGAHCQSIEPAHQNPKPMGDTVMR